MRSRSFALTALVILTALLAACAPIGNFPAPTAAPATDMPAVLPAVTSPALKPETIVTDVATLTPTQTLPVTPTLAIAETVATPDASNAAPEMTAVAPMTPTITTEQPPEGPPTAAMNSYRDELAGFEIDYPASWSSVDVTTDTKQESLSYSITLQSWMAREPGGQGIPEGGSKVDIGVTKGGAASPDAAVESRRQEWSQGDPASQVTFEELWELQGGLTGTRWTIQTSRGETVHELVTAINGNRIVVSGVGDPAQFEQIAMTLRPLGATVEGMGEAAAGATQAAETPAAQLEEPAAAPLASNEAVTAESAASTVYTVRRGDTLRSISARFGVTIAAILGANPQIKNPDLIYVGQRITIPTSGSTQPPPTGTTGVNIYMIGMGGGNVGCGDQVVAVRRDVPKTASPLTAALNLLLSQKSQYYGESGLYNALYQSNLKVASITRSGSAWTIQLTGTLQLGGVCDNPRIKAQLEETARQFSTVQSVRYFINGRPLDEVLSGR